MFDSVVREAGGKAAAAKLAGVSCSTMSRWISNQPGEIFGPRKDARQWRSLWFGYPSPFPGLDRVVEEVLSEETSFVSACADKFGIQETIRWIKGFRGFGLDRLGLPDREIDKVCRSLGVPSVTSRRWRGGLHYPLQWRHLDRLCQRLGLGTWLEHVLVCNAPNPPRKVSREALCCMLREIEVGRR